ncbi:uncharacterized protein L3040_001430 [Drepanopeziza brunnea f. sp. 'multigermtubi']|uniref:Uncharacterized protein n=1 Tax=Marssonina brunnea f. sp. multigermtubi (strain MB_m1) TaxID=1072389 RepID=K1XVJ2_MARBU|nr:uncharacterized protein MBM_05158 [Drepanopeziza brunnea f. sp. 'multigermtubi' MB_m1]EKD16689.1 hypothetical protein MBM_05158 [Drepanopeziza brunnea f. sp. 'multigermtubi' MB_m1]KAJ5051655.1 hypothetical protein L3040_001430 [Drepanopeziza brunnea f. sp. 'multigermtubi']
MAIQTAKIRLARRTLLYSSPASTIPLEATGCFTRLGKRLPTDGSPTLEHGTNMVWKTPIAIPKIEDGRASIGAVTDVENTGHDSETRFAAGEKFILIEILADALAHPSVPHLEMLVERTSWPDLESVQRSVVGT